MQLNEAQHRMFLSTEVENHPCGIIYQDESF